MIVSGSYRRVVARPADPERQPLAVPLLVAVAATAIEAAVTSVFDDGLRTADIMPVDSVGASAGRLTEVLAGWTPTHGRFQLYYASRKYLPAGLRAFVNLAREMAPRLSGVRASPRS